SDTRRVNGPGRLRPATVAGRFGPVTRLAGGCRSTRSPATSTCRRIDPSLGRRVTAARPLPYPRPVTDTVRVRREPPAFRHATVVRVEPRASWLVRLTVAGPELAGFDAGLPASSIRLLVPDPRERRTGL